MQSLIHCVAVAAFVFVAGSAIAQEPPPSAESLEKSFPKTPYSPWAGRGFPSRPLWGDTHVHTAYSMDAGAFGARLLPPDAYRFAKGEELVSSTGLKVKLARPLDFLVVADHSDNMGFFPKLFAGDPKMLADETGRRWYNLVQQGGDSAVQVAMEIIDLFSRGEFPEALAFLPGSDAYRSAWGETIKAAEEAYEPGRFTAFIGWEWTSQVPPGNNLHRVIIYRDGANKAGLMEPYTTLPPMGSGNPRDLWKWMQAYNDKTTGSILAIAHNGNLSNGFMFRLNRTYDGGRVDKEYAETRERWEPLYEVTQIKGDGEAHPFLSPNDEFADFENWDRFNLNMSEPKEESMLQNEYAREALKLGLLIEERTGTNPYKFGMIGSTDTHTALSTADSDNFFGKHAGTEPSAKRVNHAVGCFGENCIYGWEQVASGYAAVWAHENTRESIYDAMKRKEVYATTGPRILVRFFGGWDFEAADANTRSPAVAGYAKGISMGGDLHNPPEGKSPTFLVAALRDPIGANLDRLQIVKGWTDGGERFEKVYDVAWSDDRQVGADGKLPPVGSTVNVADATYTNTIGDPEMIAVWEDPDFNPDLHAFYYVRVLEIPTPRWTAYDANYYGIEVGDEVPMVIQERAYTSPIWYTP